MWRMVSDIVNHVSVETETCNVDEIAVVHLLVGCCAGHQPDIMLHELSFCPQIYRFLGRFGVMVGANPVVAAAHGQDGEPDFFSVDTGGEDAVHHLVEGAVAAGSYKMPYPVFAQRFGGGDAVTGFGQPVKLELDSKALKLHGNGLPSLFTFLLVGIDIE